MTFRAFIATHRRIEGFDDLRDADLCSLHMIEFARWRSEIETQDQWLDAVRGKLLLSQRQFLDHPARSTALQLWSLYTTWKILRPEPRPARRNVGL